MRWGPSLGLLALSASAALGAVAYDPPHRAAPVNYALHCQGCHLPDGSGMPGKVPDMRGQLGRYMRVPGGRDYIVQVPGSATARISDREAADLLNWLVPRMGPDDKAFTPYTAREVGPLRRNWLKQPLAVRTALLAQLAKEQAASVPTRPAHP